MVDPGTECGGRTGPGCGQSQKTHPWPRPREIAIKLIEEWHLHGAPSSTLWAPAAPFVNNIRHSIRPQNPSTIRLFFVRVYPWMGWFVYGKNHTEIFMSLLAWIDKVTQVFSRAFRPAKFGKRNLWGRGGFFRWSTFSRRVLPAGSQ